MDSWNIRMTMPLTLVGRINGAVEYLVYRYSELLDKATSEKEAANIVKEFVYTMHSHGVDVVEGTL